MTDELCENDDQSNAKNVQINDEQSNDNHANKNDEQSNDDHENENDDHSKGNDEVYGDKYDQVKIEELFQSIAIRKKRWPGKN